MKRIDTATRAPNLYGAGKDGFRDGDIAAGFVPTDLNALWCNGLQEEVVGVVEGSGLVPTGEDLSQLLKAIKRMAGGNVRTLTAGATALTVDDAGLVLVNAAGGAVTITLPAANVLKAARFTIRRIDTVIANAVTVSRTGTNVIDEGGTSFSLLNRGDVREIVSDGATAWRSAVGPNSGRLASAGSFALPNGIIVQWGSAIAGGGGGVLATYAQAFPNAALAAVASANATAVAPNIISVSPTPSNISMYASNGSGAAIAGLGIFYIVIGY